MNVFRVELTDISSKKEALVWCSFQVEESPNQRSILLRLCNCRAHILYIGHLRRKGQRLRMVNILNILNISQFADVFCLVDADVEGRTMLMPRKPIYLGYEPVCGCVLQ